VAKDQGLVAILLYWASRAVCGAHWRRRPCRYQNIWKRAPTPACHRLWRGPAGEQGL